MRILWAAILASILLYSSQLGSSHDASAKVVSFPSLERD